MTGKDREPFAFRLLLTILFVSVSAFGTPTCDKERRTGSWIDIQCTEAELTSTTDYSPQDRWEAADGNAAWDDTMFRWMNCDRYENIKFSDSIRNFLHAYENPICELFRQENSCGSMLCEAHNGPSTAPEKMAGAGAYLVWNSIVRVTQVSSSAFFC